MATRYYLNRLSQAVITLGAAVSLSFGLIRLLPGGPADYLRAQLAQGDSGLSQEEINQRIELYINVRPDEPLYMQYVDYILSLLQGDLGQSVFYNEPVMDILARALPWTVFVMSVALFLNFTIGILLGGYQAYIEGSRLDSGITIATMFVGSIPYYIFAILFLAVFSYEFGLFPSGGRMPQGVTPALSLPFFIGALHHAALPILSLVFTSLSSLEMRGNSIQILGQDYMRVAKLRGLGNRRITTRYIIRNAILPMYTNLLRSIATVFSGSVILEAIFSYPGVGWYVFKSFQTRDYPLMMGGFLLTTTAIVAGLTFADLTYGLIDPRLKTGEAEEAF